MSPKRSSGRLSLFVPLCVCVMVVLAGIARADNADPATARVNGFYDTLLSTMKQAKQLGIKGRYDKLAPVLAKTYDLAAMSRIAVGQSWNSLPEAQKTAIVNAFSRMTAATYAARFDNYSGETFQILGTADQPNGDKMVKTVIVQSDGKTVPLNYLMRKSGSDWKIIDVYLNGTISELANRRAEFGAILSSGGPNALVSSLAKQSDKLLGGS